jgi:hypothetical protein
MATIASAVNTVFTPAAGDFIVQCATGVASIQRRSSAGAAWTNVGVLTGNDSPIISNPVSGAQYQFTVISGTPVVQADQ